jgi:hypothetical protein
MRKQEAFDPHGNTALGAKKKNKKKRGASIMDQKEMDAIKAQVEKELKGNEDRIRISITTIDAAGNETVQCVDRIGGSALIIMTEPNPGSKKEGGTESMTMIFGSMPEIMFNMNQLHKTVKDRLLKKIVDESVRDLAEGLLDKIMAKDL